MLSDRAPNTKAGWNPGRTPRTARVLRRSPPAEELAKQAAARSIELFPVAPRYHNGRIAHGCRDGVVLGHTALAEHDFENGLSMLGDVLAARS